MPDLQRASGDLRKNLEVKCRIKLGNEKKKKVCLHDGLKSLEKSWPGVAPTGADDEDSWPS